MEEREGPKQLCTLPSRGWGAGVLCQTPTPGVTQAAADCWGGGCREPGGQGPPVGEGGGLTRPVAGLGPCLPWISSLALTLTAPMRPYVPHSQALFFRVGALKALSGAQWPYVAQPCPYALVLRVF